MEQKISVFSGLVDHLFNRQMSNFVYIFGRRESGKTDLALKISERINIPLMATNIKVLSSPYEFKYITDLQTLTRWCKLNSKRKLFILDEVGKSMSKREWYKKVNIEMINKLQILRKYKLNLIFVTPYSEWLDKGLLHPDLMDGYFQRFNKQHQNKALYFDIYDSRLPRPITLKNITRTRINFDSFDVAPFTEKPKIPDIVFRDREIKLLWKWAKGSTLKELGVHNMEINRLCRKYILDSIENQASQLQDNQIESNV